MISENADPVYRSLNQIITFIRSNKVASWCFAVFVGFLFRYAYLLTKDSFWSNRNLSFITELIDPFSESQLLFLGLILNFVVDFTSSLMPALICGAVLVYIFQVRAILFSIGAVATFLVLSSRLWHFWKAPHFGLQISTIMGPILSGLILVLSVWLLLKIRNRITISSPNAD